jgi:hypothetical protein
LSPIGAHPGYSSHLPGGFRSDKTRAGHSPWSFSSLFVILAPKWYRIADFKRGFSIYMMPRRGPLGGRAIVNLIGTWDRIEKKLVFSYTVAFPFGSLHGTGVGLFPSFLAQILGLGHSFAMTSCSCLPEYKPAARHFAMVVILIARDVPFEICGVPRSEWLT